MTEPLLTARQALLVEGCLDDVVRARPVWMGAWISGLFAGTLSTLPPDDPWRHIHARYKGRDFGDLSVDLTAPVTSERDQPTWAVRLTRGPSRPDRPGVSTGPPCRPRARRCRGRLARSLRGVAHRCPVTERNPHTLRRPRTRRPPLPSPPPLACHRRLPGGAARRRPSEAGLPGLARPGLGAVRRDRHGPVRRGGAFLSAHLAASRRVGRADPGHARSDLRLRPVELAGRRPDSARRLRDLRVDR